MGPIPKKMALEQLASRLAVDPTQLELTLKKTAFSACKTNEEFIAGIIVANTYQLNPILKEMYIFPAKGGGVMPIVSIDGWISLVLRQPSYDGHTFEVVEDKDAKGGISSVTTKIYVKGRTHPCTVTEFMAECFQGNKEPWTKWPRRMLQHKSFIQCARYAFGFSGLYDPDEAGRIQETADPNAPIISLNSDNAEQATLPPVKEDEAPAAAPAIETVPEPAEEKEEIPTAEQIELAMTIEAAIAESTDAEQIPMVRARFERHFGPTSTSLTKKQRLDLNSLIKKKSEDLSKGKK